MDGASENRSSCPLCRGELRERSATIPFVVGDNVLVVRDAPAEVCEECGEPFLAGEATDIITGWLRGLHDMTAQVSIVTYPTSPGKVA